jgi:hypothetical protein
MGQLPKFDSTALSAAMRVGRPPVHLTREGRVRLVAQVAKALLAGKKPPVEAALFVGGALLKWLQEGGNLERDYLAVRAPRGSHRTPQALISDERSPSENAARLGLPQLEEGEQQ